MGRVGLFIWRGEPREHKQKNLPLQCPSHPSPLGETPRDMPASGPGAALRTGPLDVYKGHENRHQGPGADAAWVRSRRVGAAAG